MSGGFLSKPVRKKYSSDGSHNRLVFGASGMQGWRSWMEDTYISYPDFDKNISLFGIFGGHGGP